MTGLLAAVADALVGALGRALAADVANLAAYNIFVSNLKYGLMDDRKRHLQL